LKNADNQTYQALNTLNSKRRVILSGTPIQNDLTEYFSLLSFIIPGVLGTNADFRKKYELPILRGRDADASEDQRKKGEECLAELSAVANKFIIRRTAELLTKYCMNFLLVNLNFFLVPTKYEYIVFCKMTEPQIKVYKHFAKLGLKKILSDEEKAERGKSKSTGGQDSLKAMILMKKIVNHPALLVEKDIPPGLLPPDFNFNECQTQYSGKFMLLDGMIRQMKAESTDKIVLISNYTQTLDLIDKLCRTRRWPNFRLDGTMTIAKRQKIVDQFNDPSSPQFIFLLSSKAGGCGINLIGANRLILFDPDWYVNCLFCLPVLTIILRNPANDAQAMARVWRDGQKKTCFLYRLISTGSIEEKIFQSKLKVIAFTLLVGQAHKQSLSSCVVDEEQDVERHFSLDSLRQLFILNETTSCDTHDTFKCKRCQNGKQILRPPNEGIISAGATAADTSTWNHYSHLELQKIHDSVLNKQAKETGMVTYTFQNKSHDSIPKPPKN
jgi:DNA repair and recombination RAD54-like protein